MKRLLLLLAASCLGVIAAAQPIPADPAFRVGKLGNGMTYYLYHNELPAGCADFYIAHNVGAMQEEDNQNGLAHFLEHMAFNGTRHYPGKQMLDFLAKDGVRFGYNVNAYTSRNETVYNISSVPLVRESFIDSVLLVLHDWSCDISCEQKALDDERGVISEEWRLRDDSRYRMMCLQNALVYKGSRQPERTVLGTLEVINGFKRGEILDFYHKWYRPGLQAIVIVGDFDVDAMELKVKKTFSDIQEPENPEPKVRYTAPALEEPLFEDMTDSHLKFNALKIIYKQPYPDTCARRSEEYIKDFFCRNIITSVMCERLKAQVQSEGCPARSAVAVTSEYEPDYFITLFTVSPRGKAKITDCLEMTYREIRRMREFGISDSEFEVAKLATLQRFHLDRRTPREEVKNGEIVKAAVEHFLRNHPLVNPADLRGIEKRILSALGPDDVKGYAEDMFGRSEVIYSTLYNPVEEPDAAPSADEMKAVIAKVDGEALSAGFTEYAPLDLSPSVAEEGRIICRKQRKGLGGYEQWKLSNGATVYFRKAAPVKSNDHLVMTFRFATGFRSLPADRLASSRFAASYDCRNTGFRNCIHGEFKNYPELSGIGCILSNSYRASQLELTAGAGKQENAFRLASLMLSEPCFGNPEKLSKSKEDYLRNLAKKKSPRTLFEEKYRKEVYGSHPWMAPIDSAAVEAVDEELLKEVYSRMTGDPKSLKLFITSDLDRSEIETLVLRYVGSLKGSGSKYKLTRTAYPTPVIKGRRLISETNAPESEPVSVVNCTWLSKEKTTTRNIIISDILDYIMSARYLSLIREERGGTYHVGYSTEVPDDPRQPWKGVVDFQTRPEMTETLLSDVKAEMERMCASGPAAEEMELACKYILKRHGEVERRVAGSLRQQHERLLYTELWGRDFDADYESLLKGISTTDVRDFARRFRSGTLIEEVYTEE